MPSYNFFRGASPGLSTGGRRLAMMPGLEERGYADAMNVNSLRGLRDSQAQKALVEAALKNQELTDLQARPQNLRRSAAAMAGVADPEFTDFEEFQRTGAMPTRVVEDDAAQMSRVEPRYNWTPEMQAKLRAGVQSIYNALGANQPSDALNIAKAGSEVMSRADEQLAIQAALRGQNPTANAYLLKKGQSTFDNVGNTGGTLDKITGAQSVVGGSNPIWEQFKSLSDAQRQNQLAHAGSASASAERTRAGMAGEAAQNIAKFLDANGNVVEVATVVSTDPKTRAKGYRRMQFNPQTGQFDLPVQAGLKPVAGQGDPLIAAILASQGLGQPGTGQAPAHSRESAGQIGGGIDRNASRQEANTMAVQKGWRVGGFVEGRGWEMLDPSGKKVLGYADGK